MPSVQEYIEEHVPSMNLPDICEIEAQVEELGFDPDNPDIPTLIELIEEAGYEIGDAYLPEEDFSKPEDEPSEDDF